MIRLWSKHHNKKAEVHFETARRGGIWAIYKLFNRYYLKSFFGPFFTFVFPVIIFAIIGSTATTPSAMFPGIVSMAGMSAGITGMPFAIMELKKSVILKRIGASPVKPSKFTIVILTYFTGIIFLSIGWMMMWACILFPTQANDFFDGLGAHGGLSAIEFLLGNIINIALSLSIGFFIAAISKGEQQAQAIGMLIYFPSTFLAGQFIPMESIASNDVLNWISRCIPFRYTTLLINGPWFGNDIFQIQDVMMPITVQVPVAMSAADVATWAATNGTAIPPMGWVVPGQFTEMTMSMKLYDDYEVIIAYVVPISFMGLATFGAIKKFRWSNAR